MNELYWANLPYTHGEGLPRELVKYRMAPCDGELKREASADKAALACR